MLWFFGCVLRLVGVILGFSVLGGVGIIYVWVGFGVLCFWVVVWGLFWFVGGLRFLGGNLGFVGGIWICVLGGLI